MLKLIKRTVLIASMLMLTGLSAFSLAENDNVFKQDDYEVHYSTFNTSFLNEKIASTYGIVRSKSKALLNVAVLKKNNDGFMKPVSASLTGQTYDLILIKALDFFEVREGDAVYYLAQFDIDHKIPLYFTVNVKADPNQPAMKVQFKKVLWVDGK